MKENIREQYTIIKLIRNHAQSKVKNHEQSILLDLLIDYWQSEPHYQNQNFYEHLYQTINCIITTIMYRTIDADYIHGF